MKRFHSILCAAFAALLCLSCMACGTPQNAATEAAPTAAATASVQVSAAASSESTPAPTAAPEPPAVAPIGAYMPEDDSPKLLQSAKWIWTDDTANNTWVRLQKTFTLDAVPETAAAEIAVESRYHLWVNGTLAVYDGGLKRGYDPESGYFDQLDLAPYLKAGENSIEVQAWFWGVKAQSYSSVPLDAPGFIFALDLGTETLVSDETWLAAKETAYLDDSAAGFSVPQPNDRLPEYNIYYDARTESEPAFIPASVRGAYGDAPYNRLHLRPIPLFCEYGLTDYANSADFAEYATASDEQLVLRPPYNAQLAPYLEITAEAGKVITITTENTEHGDNAVRVTYVTKDGRQAWEAPAWLSGMFITYDIPAGVTVHRLAYRESGYDSKMAGAFTMGNDFFDTLWQMGARTQYVCMRDGFMDCPDRERAQWTGDAATQLRTLLYCLNTNAHPLFKKLIAQKANWIVTGGKGGRNDLIPTVVPIYNEYYELPAQEMAGIVAAWEYYLYTGDEEIIHLYYQPALRYLHLWKQNKDGLLKHKTGQGLVDWQDTGSNKVDTKAQENALYYWALSTVKNMALALGEDTAEIDARLTALYDGYQALWVDGAGYTTTGVADDRANAFAVLSGLAGEDKYETIRTALVENRFASTYTEAYVEMALCRMGYTRDALDRMQQQYGGMVQRNRETGMTTLWEYFTDGMGTWNHAWAASPVYTLSAFVGGIRPTAPGYTAYEIAPDFSHTDHVSVSVETVLGTIAADATADGAMTLTLPEGGTASVRVPNAAGKTVFVNGIETTGTPDGGELWITVAESGAVKVEVQ